MTTRARMRGALILLAVALVAPAAFGQAPACAAPLVVVAPDGKAEHGSKDALRAAVAAGLPVRVGWSLDADGDGAADVRHWADGMFLTEFQGEVFAQFADIQRQKPVRATGTIDLPAGRQRWSGLVGTNGVLESHFDDGSEPRSVRVRSEWCVDPRATACHATQWRLVYRHDADGNALAGSKARLFDAVRRGQPIRLAWGMGATRDGERVSVEHAADPEFVTIANGVEVVAQLAEHIGQRSYNDPEGARFDDPAVMWRGIMSTRGTFDAVLVDRATGKEVRRLPQRAGIAWFGYAPAPACDPPPLEFAVPGGVRRDG